MADTAAQLLAEIARNRPPHNSAGYPAGLRERVGARLIARHAEGLSWKMLGAELGISRTTARKWARRVAESSAERATFLPVALVSPVPVSAACPVLFTPRGYRVEGLDPEQLLQVLERLG